MSALSSRSSSARNKSMEDVRGSLAVYEGEEITFRLLTLLGLNMLRDSPDDKQVDSYDPTKGWRIIGLSLACAIDALTAGVALSLMGTDTWELAPVFGATAAGICLSLVRG